MRHGGKIVSVICSLCILVGGVSVTASAVAPSLNEQSIEVQFRQVIDLPDYAFEDKELIAQVMDATAITGWTYNAAKQRLERLVTYDNVEVTINGNETEADANGVIKVLTQPSETLKVVAYDPMIDKTYTQLVSGDSSSSTIVFDLDISKMFSIDADNEKLEKGVLTRASTTNPYWSDGEKGVYGYRLHCNRFNGWMGDGCYYSSKVSPKAILNFTGSDCDLALIAHTYCLADYGPNPYCAASPASKQASCSTLMGHYNRFHMHTSNPIKNNEANQLKWCSSIIFDVQMSTILHTSNKERNRQT